MPRDGSWQAKAGEGFDAPAFRVDWEAKSMTCLGGEKSKRWKPALNRHGRDVVAAVFDEEGCAA